MDVFVGGGMDVSVVGGIGVCVGFGNGVSVAEGLGSRVRAAEVAVTTGGAFVVGVRVTTRVDERVAVGVRDAVAGEIVGVEEAPSRAASVCAMAVRVRLAFCTSDPMTGSLREFQSITIKAINRAEAPRACK
jgi:hypothetical protein